MDNISNYRFTPKDFKSDQEVKWCPGCGDHAILNAVQKALPIVAEDPRYNKETFTFVSGIGCSSRFPYYMKTFGFHSIHGRAAAIATGSGNAPFYAFVELAPQLAVKLGLSPAFLIIPMLQASNLGRTISPVSGVIVATSGMAQISPFEVVKRTVVPVLCGLVTVIIGTMVLVPMYA